MQIAQSLIDIKWNGISSKQSFIERQQNDPLILAMGRKEQRHGNMIDISSESFLDYFRLKSLQREGWKRVGIELPESVASHSWGMALLAMAYCPKDLDQLKVLKLALLHDLPEIEVGDITPHDGVSKSKKAQLEQEAAAKMLPKEWYELWNEYQEKKTRESMFVSRIDKLDMAIQALVYSNEYPTHEFIVSALKEFGPHEKDIFEQLQQRSK